MVSGSERMRASACTSSLVNSRSRRRLVSMIGIVCQPANEYNPLNPRHYGQRLRTWKDQNRCVARNGQRSAWLVRGNQKQNKKWQNHFSSIVYLLHSENFLDDAILPAAAQGTRLPGT